MSTNSTKTYEYQTEIKKLLDIVIHSLYKNREIFVRELISNAADSLEKYRHIQLSEKNTKKDKLPLEINIEVSKDAKTFVISDTGIGMTKDELITNLGTIAHSGSGEFLKNLDQLKGDPANLIGQFGVGFYSAFMVADSVKFITRSYQDGSEGLVWQSDGKNDYTIDREEGIERGARIVLNISDDYKDYTDPEKIKSIIKQYSNFVGYPIKVNGEQVNTIEAIWTKTPSDIKDKEYIEFYKFLTNSYSDPKFWSHISTDAPIQMNALLFFPNENIEKFGFSRLEPGVNLYCNKILIETKVKELLPEYFRFVKGIVDSEDLPLNISRETLQDNRVIGKIRKFLVKRIIKFLQEQAKNKPDTYLGFWKEFGQFIKEGVHTDFDNKNELAKLLRFETSKTKEGEFKSLETYVADMDSSQKDIYYIHGDSRSAVDSSPYLEMFKSNDMEVLYLYDPIDDFVLASLMEFDGKKIISCDNADIKFPKAKKGKDDKKSSKDAPSEKEVKKFAEWMKTYLKDRITDVKVSTRLTDSPAILVNPDDHMTTHMQKIMQATQADFKVGNKMLEINPDNVVINKMVNLWKSNTDSDELKLTVDQLVDNTFLLAGLPVDTKSMVDRIHKLMGNQVD